MVRIIKEEIKSITSERNHKYGIDDNSDEIENCDDNKYFTENEYHFKHSDD